MNSPLKWHGGKHYLAEWILSHAPEHTHYVEPFFGGGSVLFSKMPSASEVVNDLNGHLANFWACLRDPEAFARVVRRAQATPFSTDCWAEALRLLSEAEKAPKEPDDLLAWAFLVAVRQSRQGLLKSFATLSRARTRRGMNEQAASWLTAVEGLPEAHERLKGIVVLNEPAIDVIRREDSPNTWMYLDPPYLLSTRVSKKAYGNFEMSDEEHFKLLETLSECKGKFALSGYRNEMYDQAAEAMGWRREEKEIPNHSSSTKNKPTMVECLWMNY